MRKRNIQNQKIEKITSSEKRKIFNRTMLFFLPSLFTLLIITILILLNYDKFEIESFKKSENSLIKIPTQRIKYDIDDITADLLVLASQSEVKQLFDSPRHEYDEVLNLFSNELLDFSIYKKKYDQIRLLDENGQEIVRINFNEGLPVIVKKEGLQNKKNRYYFSDAFKLNKGEVFISPLDLNIERGEIEMPLKPMVRIATPIFDKNDKKRGIVLMNYFGSILIDNFKKHLNLTNKECVMLLNSDGYWLSSPNIQDEWGFMFKERQSISFKNKFPKAWERINKAEKGQFQMASGLFTFETIYPLLEGQISATGAREAFAQSSSQINSEQYYWKSVSYVFSRELDKLRKKRRLNAVILDSFLALFLLISSIIIALNTSRRKKAEAKIIESEAKYRLIIENSGDPIVIRQNRKFQFANKALSKMLGYSIDELLKFDSKLLFDSEMLSEMDKRVLKNDVDETVSIQFETQLIKKNKSKIDVEISEKLMNFNGVKAQLIVIHDITQQKEIIKILKKGAAQTKGLNEFIPICAGCSLIRDDEKEGKPWVKPADYISERLPKIKFSHTMCPDCVKKWYPDIGE